MNKCEIKYAYDAVTPTAEQKNRMLRNIVSSASAAKKKTGRYEARPTENRSFFSAIAAVLVISLLAGGAIWLIVGADRDPAYLFTPDETQPDPTQTTLEQENVPAPTWIDAVLELYRTALQEDWDVTACENAGISYMCGYEGSAEILGYALMDLDGNGKDELIISDGDVIYDLYTEVNGETVHVFSGWERNSYCLCEGNIIRNIASGGAGYTVYTFSTLQGGDLVWIDIVTCDAEKENGPWFVDRFNVSATQVPVDEETASGIIDGYLPIPLETEPILDVIAEFQTEDDGEAYLILPLSKTKIPVKSELSGYLDKVDMELLTAAEEKLSDLIQQYEQHSGFYLQVVEGRLYLCAEAIVKLDPTASAGDTGFNHEHKFFSEPITEG